MRKNPSDVTVSENCIDANLEMVERRVPDNIPRFPPQEWCVWTIPEIALKRGFCADAMSTKILYARPMNVTRINVTTKCVNE